MSFRGTAIPLRQFPPIKHFTCREKRCGNFDSTCRSHHPVQHELNCALFREHRATRDRQRRAHAASAHEAQTSSLDGTTIQYLEKVLWYTSTANEFTAPLIAIVTDRTVWSCYRGFAPHMCTLRCEKRYNTTSFHIHFFFFFSSCSGFWSFSSVTNSGEPRKMDEYVPAMMPMISARTK